MCCARHVACRHGRLSWAEVRGIHPYDLGACAPNKGYLIILVGEGRTDQEEQFFVQFLQKGISNNFSQNEKRHLTYVGTHNNFFYKL